MQLVEENRIPEFDNLYLGTLHDDGLTTDMNGIIHNWCDFSRLSNAQLAPTR